MSGRIVGNRVETHFVRAMPLSPQLSRISRWRLERLTDVADPEVALNRSNKKVKNLIQKLGEAIHESVSESENIAEVVKDIREQGFDVLLMLEATIGLNEVDMDEAESVETEGGATDAVEGPFTNHDLNFLKSLRISISEESNGGHSDTE